MSSNMPTDADAGGGKRLLDRVQDALAIRHYSPRTAEAYGTWIRRFIRFHHRRHPAEMGAPEVAAFLTSLATTGNVSSSTQNQALAAILFLYSDVLHQSLESFANFVRAKKPQTLPNTGYFPGSLRMATAQVVMLRETGRVQSIKNSSGSESR